MNFKLILFIVLISGQILSAQNKTKFYLNYEWDKKPLLHKTDEKYKNNDFYVVN